MADINWDRHTTRLRESENKAWQERLVTHRMTLSARDEIRVVDFFIEMLAADPDRFHRRLHNKMDPDLEMDMGL